MKCMKKITAVIIIIAMISVLLSTAVSASLAYGLPIYLNLGDSIASAYGLKNKTDGYASLLAKDRYMLSDFAVSGYDSSDLLTQLSGVDAKIKSDLENAALITVSIGGNNFLGPFTDVISKMDMSGINMNNVDPNQVKQSDILRMMTQFTKYFTPGTSEYRELTRELDKGEAQFKKDIDEIIKILAKNKDAKIIFLTVYNPYKGFDSLIKGFESMTETYIQKLNDIIKEKASGTYPVADVYSAFKKAENKVLNSNSSMLAMNMDVHPNAAGHKLIYKTIAHSFSFSIYFNDMAQDSRAVEAVDNLHEKGIVFGTSTQKRQFSPNAGINHADLAIWFVRAFKLKIGDADVADVKLPFSDIDKIPTNALNSVKACYKAGIYSQIYLTGKIYAFEPNKITDNLTAVLMTAQMIDKSKWSDKAPHYKNLHLINEDYHAALATIEEYNLMGTIWGNVTFTSSVEVTRAQAACIIYNLLEQPELIKK